MGRLLIIALVIVNVLVACVTLSGCGGGGDASETVSTYQPVDCGQQGACT